MFYYNSITATGTVLQMMNTDHCYYLNVTTSSGVILHLLQPHPPTMSPEGIQQSVDQQVQLVKLLQQWERHEHGSKAAASAAAAASRVLCPLCKDQPHPLDHLLCKGQPVVLSEHTKLLMNTSKF